MTTFADAGCTVVAVVEKIGRDESEVGRFRDALQVIVKLRQRYDVLLTGRVIDDRMKINKRIVSRGVLRLFARANVIVWVSENWMPAVLIHVQVFDVPLPLQLLRFELIRNRANGIRIDASDA